MTILWSLGAGCSPTQKCGGALYYDAENFSCRPCPSGARFDDGACACADGAQFINHRCVADDPSDAGMDAGAVSPECQSYCNLVNVCLAGNDFAQSVVPTVISGLYAAAPGACASACTAAGGDGALAACIEAGREAAACAGSNTQDGLTASIMLLAQCSRAHASDPLKRLICDGLMQSPLVANQIDFCD